MVLYGYLLFCFIFEAGSSVVQTGLEPDVLVKDDLEQLILLHLPL